MDGPRTRYTDDRLDDKFDELNRRMSAVDNVPVLLAQVSTQVATLSQQLERNFASSERRMDDFEREVSDVGRAVWYLLAGLLFVAMAAVLGVVIVL